MLRPGDYKEIKNRYEHLVNGLENRHRNLSQDNSDLDEMIVFGRYFIQRLDRLYLESNLAMKQ